MQWFLNLWNWLNGNKTVFASYLALFLFGFNELNTNLLVPVWHFDLTTFPFFNQLIGTVTWLTGILGSVGLAHKAAKYLDTQSSPTA